MGDICPRLIRIATEACNHQETFMFLRKVVDELDKHMLEFQKRQISNTQDYELLSKGIEIASVGDCSTQVKGFRKEKNNEGEKGLTCMKGWVEQHVTRQRKNDATMLHKVKKPLCHNLMVSQVQYEVPNSSAPKWLNDAYNQQSMENNDPLSQFGVNSFTSLLMGQLDEDYTTLTKP
ncbi:far-red impaired response 1-like protein [Sesbania bispinosa]|nr:far-red impaired response 1-like protein [Sesbania bispinosa]